MRPLAKRHCLPGLVLLFICAGTSPAPAQVVEAVGGRALGMAGAFVALADDSTATWWNPAGLTDGPILDLGLGWASADVNGAFPPARGRELVCRWRPALRDQLLPLADHKHSRFHYGAG